MRFWKVPCTSLKAEYCVQDSPYRMPVSILMVVDLPAPFGPMKASNSHGSSEKPIGSGNAPLSQLCIKERSGGTVEQRCKRYTLIKMNNVIIFAEHLVALRECREREGITIRRIYIDRCSQKGKERRK